MDIVALIDSFKGSMSSKTISLAIKKEFELKGAKVASFPISDGGEGFIDTIKTHFQIQSNSVEAVDPFGAKLMCEYVLYNKIAYIEMNSAAGIMLVKKKHLDPLKASTYGVGLIVKDAIEKGAKKIVLGIGGSATNDGGAGMLQALGVNFYSQNKLLEKYMNGELIGDVTSIDLDNFQKVIKNVKFQIVSDVRNPLLGKDGCAYVYSPQKGASTQQILTLEGNMKKYANVVESFFKQKFKDIEGTGAAGGTGFGCLAFLNAKISSGIKYIIKLLDIESRIKNADLVIVGEGKLDRQTKNGKAPVGIARIAKKYDVRVIGIFAIIEDGISCECFDEVYSVVPKYASIEQSINNPEHYFIKMIKEIKI